MATKTIMVCDRCTKEGPTLTQPYHVLFQKGSAASITLIKRSIDLCDPCLDIVHKSIENALRTHTPMERVK